jgi:hypothetical protein
MSQINIKKWIKDHFNLHGNQKVYLTDYNTFWITIGDCSTMEIPFPQSLMRQLLIESILKNK